MKDAAASVLRAAPTLALLGVLVLAGWLAARWFLYFTAATEAPPVPVRERVQLAATAQQVADARLFGTAPAGAGGEVLSNLNIKLKGVFAGGAIAGLAILNTGDRDQTARVGGEIVPGVVLEQVHARHVVLRRNGVLERVNLEERMQLAAAPATSVAARRARTRGAPAVAVAPAATPPQASAARFQRPEPYAPVGDVPSEPPAAGVPPPVPVVPPTPAGGAARGLTITNVPQGGMLERLGLQPGDVVRSVNGEPVAAEADVVRIVQSRGLQGTFTAEVQRGGTTVPITVTPQR